MKNKITMNIRKCEEKWKSVCYFLFKFGKWMQNIKLYLTSLLKVACKILPEFISAKDAGGFIFARE